MFFSHFIAWMFAAGVVALGISPVSSQTFPNKTIRIVAPEAGGGTDLAARLLAQRLTSSLGQQVIVDNRGGSAVIPAQIVLQAAPDGYTLLIHSSPVWLLPFMQDRVPYDPVRDFAPVTLAVSSPNILVVHPSLPVSSTSELINLAKSKPGTLNFGTSGNGSSSHLAAELFKAMAGIEIVRIPFKGLGPALNALIGGQLQLVFSNASAAMPHVKSGRLKGLAVTSLQPTALAAGLPTVSATGLAGYQSASVNGIFAPAKTPEAIIKRLNQEIVAVLNSAEMKERLFAAGTEAVGSSPEEFAAMIKDDMAKLGKVIKDAGIHGE